jgi:hypothetical protein
VDVRDGWVWLEFPESGGKAQFPPDSVALWKAKGWVETDPPAEPNLLKDPDPMLHDPQPDVDNFTFVDPDPDASPPDTSAFGDRSQDGDLFAEPTTPDAGTDTEPREA